MTNLTCTNWAFAKNEKNVFAMFQINDSYLIRYDNEDGFYIPEGEAGANLQGWSDADDYLERQQAFESQYAADEVAKECGLRSLIDEIELFEKDENYEFSLPVDSDVSGLCERNLAE